MKRRRLQRERRRREIEGYTSSDEHGSYHADADCEESATNDLEERHEAYEDHSETEEERVDEGIRQMGEFVRRACADWGRPYKTGRLDNESHRLSSGEEVHDVDEGMRRIFRTCDKVYEHLDQVCTNESPDYALELGSPNTYDKAVKAPPRIPDGGLFELFREKYEGGNEPSTRFARVKEQLNNMQHISRKRKRDDLRTHSADHAEQENPRIEGRKIAVPRRNAKSADWIRHWSSQIPSLHDGLDIDVCESIKSEETSSEEATSSLEDTSSVEDGHEVKRFREAPPCWIYGQS